MKKEIAGASFTLYPMSDRFIEIITEAIDETDTSNVWLKTDDVTTTIRGKIAHVFDVVHAIFIHAMKTGEHIGLQATFSMGCPGDVEEHVKKLVEPLPVNISEKLKYNEFAAAKFSLYPLGTDQYMDEIDRQIQAMKEYITVVPDHYSTRLTGGIYNIFKGLEKVFQAAIEGERSPHVVLTVSISANSPSHLKK